MLRINKGKDVKKSTFILFVCLLIVIVVGNFLFFWHQIFGFFSSDGNTSASDSVPSEAADFEYTATDGVAVITAYKGKAQYIVIPGSIGGNTVVGIGDQVFVGRENIKTVVIPNTVTDIGASCFQNCIALTDAALPKSLRTVGISAFESTGITEVSFPDTVTVIENSAFYGCADLKTVALPDGIDLLGAYAFDKTQWYNDADSGLLFIGDILYGCKGALPEKDSLTVPKGVRLIADAAFAGRETLKTIVFSATVKNIGATAFAGCSALTTVTLTQGLESIGSEAFNSCSSLQKVFISASVTEIAPAAFVNCQKLLSVEVDEDNKSFVSDGKALYDANATRLMAYFPGSGEGFFSVPDTVKTMDSGVFYGCKSLIAVHLPDTLTALPDSLFYGCTTLDTILIPDSVMSIADMAFYGCTALQKVQLPSFLNVLGDRVFYGCTALKALAISNSGSFKTQDGVLFSADMTTLRVYPLARRGTSYTVPDTVSVIGASAFIGAANLTEIVLPDGLTTVSDEAFAECTRLFSITIPDSVNECGGYCFAKCPSLVLIKIGKSLDTVGDGVFNDCYALRRFIVSADNKSFAAPDGVLYNAAKTRLICYPSDSAQKEYIIPETVTTVGEQAFVGCIYLESVRFGAAVTTLYQESFVGCEALKAFYVDENNKTFTAADGVLFHGNDTLVKYPTAKKGASYTVPDTVKAIESFAFESCEYLSDLTVGEKVEVIGADAFYGIAGFALHCLKGSAAQKYAESNGVEYKLIK